MARWFVLGMVLCLSACDGGGGDIDGGGADGGTDGGAGPGDVTFEIRDGRDDSVIAGATVAFDAPGGTRTESVTDAAGQVIFSPDWGLGPGACSIHADGYTVLSQVGLTASTIAFLQQDGVVPLIMGRVRAERVTVTGTVLNAADDTHSFFVGTDAPGATQSNGVGPDFSFEVPVDEPFRIFVLEYTANRAGPTEVMQTAFGATFLDVPAASADVSGVEPDLSAAATLRTADGSVTSPGVGTPLADATFYGIVSTVEAGLNDSFGAMTFSAPNAMDATVIDYTMTWAEHPDGTPVTRYFLLDDPVFSFVNVAGYPTAGPQDITFPPPPTIVTPAFGVMHPIHDPFVIGRVEPGMITSINFYDLNQEDLLVWQVTDPGGGETIELPQLPSSVSRSDLFPAGGDFYARPFVCQFDATRDYCERLAIGGRAFDLVP